MSDQQRWDTLGSVNPRIRTPHLDALAASGMRMDRAYAPTPVCLPCRASILTGQHSSTNGAMHNHSQLRTDYTPRLSDLLRGQGYYTHMIGKSHLMCCHDPKSLESAPHIHNLDYFRKWRGPWYGFEHADICIGHTTEKHACGMHYGAWLQDQGVDLGRYFGNTAYEQYGAWDLPEKYHSSTWIADVTVAAMRRAAGEGRPFFLWTLFQDPHNPCMVPEPWASMYRPDEMPAFGFKQGEPECFDRKPPFYREVLRQSGPYAARPEDAELPGTGNVSHLAWSQRQVRENAACYYGMVSLMDKHIGRILDELRRSGMAENTLVIFTSDHGDLLGDHGLWWKSMVCYDESIRVPLIASMPGRIAGGNTSRAFVSLVDLLPTICDFAGVDVPSVCEGVSQRGVWEGRENSVRDHVVVEERPYDSDFAERIIVTDTHKLAFYANRPYGELYDLAADPDHVDNLWDDPSSQPIRHELIERILSHEMLKCRPSPGPGRAAEEALS
jgi:uncharacterized sulfatase